MCKNYEDFIEDLNFILDRYKSLNLSNEEKFFFAYSSISALIEFYYKQNLIHPNLNVELVLNKEGNFEFIFDNKTELILIECEKENL